MSAEAQLTPMMAQYRRIKGELPKDALLLFRLGDFYEMFFEDAVAGAEILKLTLTKRNAIPMCGLPHHAASGYITRLLKAGRKVAICDQTEDPSPANSSSARSPKSCRPARISTSGCSPPSATTSSPPSARWQDLWPRLRGPDHERLLHDGSGRRRRAAHRTGAAAPGGSHPAR
jgi:hypothetical protein